MTIRVMRILIDLDHTLLKTEALVAKTELLVEKHGASISHWRESWAIWYSKKYPEKSPYSIWEHARRYSRNHKFASRSFLKNFFTIHAKADYLFPDALDFLKFLKKIDKVFLITYGHDRYQRWKVKISGVKRHFHQIETFPTLKGGKFEKLLDPAQINIFVDDNAVEIDEAKRVHPWIVAIHVRRPNARHPGKSKLADYKVGDLREAKEIVRKINQLFITDLDLAAKHLKAGKAVVYPTDTAYGLGVDATNVRAVKKLLTIKEREKKPTHIIVDSLAMAKKHAVFNKAAALLFKKFLPGPLTLVLELRIENKELRKRTSPGLPASPALSADRPAGGRPPSPGVGEGRGEVEALKLLSAGTGTIGIRMPDNRIALDLVKKLQRPITTPSANPAGGPAPYSVAESFKQFRNKKHQPDFYLDAGTLPKRRPSTIIKVVGNKIEILRPGPISKKQINASL